MVGRITRMAKQWRSVDECRQEARKTADVLSEEISKTAEASWKRVLEVADHDELVYKLTLKYLR